MKKKIYINTKKERRSCGTSSRGAGVILMLLLQGKGLLSFTKLVSEKFPSVKDGDFTKNYICDIWTIFFLAIVIIISYGLNKTTIT